MYEIVDLGTLGGRWSLGLDLNERGQVTGYSIVSPDSPLAPFHAFFWDGFTMIDLGTAGGRNSVGHGINDRGQIAGSAAYENEDGVAFVWDGVKILDLGTAVKLRLKPTSKNGSPSEGLKESTAVSPSHSGEPSAVGRCAAV